MKKVLAFLAVVVLAVSFFGTTACKKGVVEDPTPTPTQYVVLDRFVDGDNRTDTTAFGGYWYTFDDLAAKTTASQCGASTIWPPSDSYLVKNGIAVTPTFIMSSYATTSQTPPTGVTSAYYARVSGNVSRESATAYQYGFVGFGANLLDVAGDNYKNTINATALGYKRLRFWYKNGPSLGTGATTLWKIKLGTDTPIGAGPCTMEEVDDCPVYAFTSTDTWQQMDVALADFAPEGWGSTTCGTRGLPTNCVAGFTSYLNPGAQYRCTAAEALVRLNALQWQTNFSGTAASNPYDLMLADIVLVK